MKIEWYTWEQLAGNSSYYVSGYTINYVNPRSKELTKLYPFHNTTLVRAFMYGNTYSNAINADAYHIGVFAEYNNKFVITSGIDHRTSGGWGFNYRSSQRHVVFGSSTTKKTLDTWSSECIAIEDKLNNEHRIPTLIETDIINKKAEKFRLL